MARPPWLGARRLTSHLSCSWPQARGPGRGRRFQCQNRPSSPVGYGTAAKNRKTDLGLAIAPKTGTFRLSLDTFFTSMTWKSSGEPGSMMI